MCICVVAALTASRTSRHRQTHSLAVNLNHTPVPDPDPGAPVPQDVDQRITRDVERLAGDMAALVPTMVKPVVDILWFSSQLWALTGRRGMAVLYIYAALGFGCLRCVIGCAV